MLLATGRTSRTAGLSTALVDIVRGVKLTREFLTSPYRSLNGRTFKPPVDRYLPRLQADGDCLVWSGACNDKGYGQMGIGGHRLAYAHRIAWVLAHGELDDEVLVLHCCDNPPCCNPDHLFLGTHQANSDDKISKGRFVRGAGRPPTAPPKVARILELSGMGLSSAAIGRRVDFSAGHVRRILKEAKS